MHYNIAITYYCQKCDAARSKQSVYPAMCEANRVQNKVSPCLDSLHVFIPIQLKPPRIQLCNVSEYYMVLVGARPSLNSPTC